MSLFAASIGCVQRDRVTGEIKGAIHMAKFVEASDLYTAKEYFRLIAPLLFDPSLFDSRRYTLEYSVHVMSQDGSYYHELITKVELNNDAKT